MDQRIFKTFLLFLLWSLISSCHPPPIKIGSMSRYYFSPERCQIKNEEYQQAQAKILAGTQAVFSANNQKDWPSGIMPVMFIVAPSGKVSQVYILENAPQNPRLVRGIKDIYLGLKFSPFTKPVPDTIVFNADVRALTLPEKNQ